ARRRRRRQGRDLQPDEPPHRARRRHHHDLFGAAGTAPHERPDSRHAPRTSADGDRRCGCHRGACPQRRAGTRAFDELRAGHLIVPARQFGTLIGLLALCAILWILTPHFMTVSNLLNVAEQTSINAIVAVGMTFVILSGGIDLSVGSIVALSGVVLGTSLQGGQPLYVAVPLALLAGIACGLANGALISWGGLPPFIVTLGTMSIARGGALLFTEGRPVSGFDASFRILATGRIGFLPAPVIAMAVVYLIAHFVLTRTTFARYVYAIGGNEEATRLSGVA